MMNGIAFVTRKKCSFFFFTGKAVFDFVFLIKRVRGAYAARIASSLSSFTKP